MYTSVPRASAQKYNIILIDIRLNIMYTCRNGGGAKLEYIINNVVGPDCGGAAREA